MKALLAIVVFCASFVFAEGVIKGSIQDDATLKLLVSAVSVLFALLVSGIGVFWNWITKQFEDMKNRINHVEAKLDLERQEQNKRIDGLFDKFFAKIEARIKTERLTNEKSDNSNN